MDCRNRRRCCLVVLGASAGAVLLYLAASGLYLGSFRLERGPDSLIVSASGAWRVEAERLVKAFAAETGKGVRFVEPPAPRDPNTSGPLGPSLPGQAAGLLDLVSSGAVDCVLAETAFPGAEAGAFEPATGFPHPAGVVPDSEAPPLYLPTLLSVRFPAPRVEVSLKEARALLESLAAGRPGPQAREDIEIIELADRTPGRQLLAVGGVYPTLRSVISGAYPLSREARLWVRRDPSGFLGWPGRLAPVRRWLEPNRALLGEFAAWLGTPQAWSVLYGIESELTLTAVGDVWFARNVGKTIDENGLDYPFAQVADRLRAADITWCSLESPLGVTGTPLPGKMLWFRAKPETVECLKPPGIDVVALANNHILDYDSPSLVETLNILDSHGIAYCGAGRDASEARRPAVLEAQGLKVAFLAYTEYADPQLFWSPAYPRTFLAGEDVPGCNPLDLDIVAEDIARAREVADLVVVGYHWGRENEEYPTPYRSWRNLPEIARRTIDLGACLVLGTHPHAIQGFEVRGAGLIAYSLGNFVTDQIQDSQREGVILDLELGPSGVLSARITPVWSEGFRPEIMDPERGRALLEKVERISWVYRERP